MTEPPDRARAEGDENQGLRELLQENVRLRMDIEELLRKQQQFLDRQNGQPQGQNGDGKKDGGGKDGQPEDEQKKNDEQKPEPKPPLRQRIRAWVRVHPLGTLLIIAAAIILLIGAYLFWMYLQSYVDTDDAEVGGHINPISSRVAGTVTAVYVENTQRVNDAQVLVDLDPRDYETALAHAQANLAQALAALENQQPNVPITQTTQSTNVSTARLEVDNDEAALAAARQSHESALADLEQAEAGAANAEAEERRYRHMVEKQEVSREAYDQRATTARQQDALVAARRASAKAAEQQVAQRESALAQARERYREEQANLPRQVYMQHAAVASRKANVEAARAQVEQARLNLSYCKILAPVGGIVGDKTVEAGQQVSPGQELLAVTPITDIWVTANFKETQTRLMRPGQAVTIHVDALDQDFNGYVENMPGATGAKYSLLPPENATGNYVKVVQRLPVRIRFKPNQRNLERLRPGMSVEPKVWLQ